MTIQQTNYSEHQLTMFHDPEAKPNPTEYTVFLHGQVFAIAARDGESSLDLWTRVLGTLHNHRMAIQRSKTVLAHDATATVYAGALTEESLAKLRRRHMRNFLLQRAHEEANNYKDGGTGASRTAALALLARLTGVGRRRK